MEDNIVQVYYVDCRIKSHRFDPDQTLLRIRVKTDWGRTLDLFSRRVDAEKYAQLVQDLRHSRHWRVYYFAETKEIHKMRSTTLADLCLIQ